MVYSKNYQDKIISITVFFKSISFHRCLNWDATAAVVTMGKASAFKSGREFVAYVGLVPKQAGTDCVGDSGPV